MKIFSVYYTVSLLVCLLSIIMLDTSELELDDDDAVQEVWKRLGKLTEKDMAVVKRKSLEKYGPPVEHESRSSPHMGHMGPSASMDSHYAASGLMSGKHITVETSNKKLKPFSANAKLGNGEVDYKHWRRAALRVIEDHEISEGQKRNVLLQSLVGAAEDSIDLDRGLPCRELLDVLDKLYGTTVDSRNLLADFFQLFQQPNQTVSEYLNVLYVRLAEIVTLHGLDMEELPKTLLMQFIRGVNVADEDIIHKLGLEEKEDDPPNFPDLFILVRREESRRTERRLRHKRLVKSQSVVVDSASTSDQSFPSAAAKLAVPPSTASVDALQKEMAKIQLQLSTLLATSNSGSGNPTPGSPSSSNVAPGLGMKGFCYRCGQDGHFAPACTHKPNKVLVKEKKETRQVAADAVSNSVAGGNSSGNWR